ncbi:hypothetical protein GF386_04095 [Candidatus Pacearchaeota archaeon]|nr:hypothetical protein [Candidatus Pacearchaeota archaeon]
MKIEERKHLKASIITIMLISFGFGVVLIFAINAGLIFEQEPEVNNLSIEKLYSKLPEVPDDFLIIKRDIETGDLTELCKIEEGYYKNPDLYPTWERARKMFYKSHNYNRWGVHGYGAYPSEIGYKLRNFKENESLELCTFFKTGYNIETYQGVKLIPIKNEFFDIQIITQEFEEYPNHFLLEPTFPLFKNEWAKKIKLNITAKQDIPVGVYTLGFDVVTPDDKFDNIMRWEVLMKETKQDTEYIKKCMKKSRNDGLDKECSEFMMKRQKKYISGGGFQTGEHIFKLIIEVIE